MPNYNIFEVPDYGGIIVVLSEQQWKRKILSSAPTGHPEVGDYLDVIRRMISDPDVVFESTRRADTHLFYLMNAGQGKYEGKHLVVVIKYVQESEGLRGYVSTAYLARGVYSRGRILWQRKRLLRS